MVNDPVPNGQSGAGPQSGGGTVLFGGAGMGPSQSGVGPAPVLTSTVAAPAQAGATPGFKQAFVPAVGVPGLMPDLGSPAGATFNEGKVEAADGLDFEAIRKQQAGGQDQVATPKAGILKGLLPRAAAPEVPNTAAATKKPPLGKALPDSTKKLIYAGLGVLFVVVLGVLGWSWWMGREPVEPEYVATPPPQRVALEYWGLWEPDEVMLSVLRQFEAENNATINYVKQDIEGYREKLQTAIEEGNGPDVFRYHVNWVPMLGAELEVMGSEVYTVSNYQDVFYPVVGEKLVVEDELGVVGVPIMYDGLTLVYNRDLIADADIPKSWADFLTKAKNLTTKDAEGRILQSGAAIGLADNIDHFSDVIGWLAMEAGVDLTFADPNDQANLDLMRGVLDAYTYPYTNPDEGYAMRTWDESMPNSLEAFAQGRVAMIFVSSYRLLDLKNMNPNLDIGVATLPVYGTVQDPTWASFWVEGVNVQSPVSKKEMAGKLLKYLSSPAVEQTLYQDQKDLGRPIGEIYSRVDIRNSLAGDPYAAPVLQDAPRAETFYLTGNTWDAGLNDELIQYYADAVNMMTTGREVTTGYITPEQALGRAVDLVVRGTEEVLTKYGVIGGEIGGGSE